MSNGAIEVPALVHLLRLTRLSPSNFSTRMSIAAVKTVQAHTMGSTALEKKKEPAMPAREGCRC